MGILKNNRKGWIKIVEAFTAILLIAGIFLVILEKGQIQKEDPAEKIYQSEVEALKKIQQNETLREMILSVAGPLPVNSSSFPIGLENAINSEIPNYLDCEKLICVFNGECIFYLNSEKDIYARSVTISSTLNEYNPRQLKLFCWVK